MSKKQKSLRAKLANNLVSVLILAVVILPLILTFKWAGGIIGDKDPRQVTAVEQLQTRPEDQSTAPIKLFDEPYISVTFDDGWQSIYTDALPIMQKRGIKTTQYVLSGTFENQAYMTAAQMQSMQKAGHDMGSHTVSHSDLTMLDDQQLDMELGDSKKDLSRHLGPIEDFTSPYGAYNSHTLKVIGKYYRSQKNAEGDATASAINTINLKASFDPLNIKSFSIKNTTTLADLEKLIAETKANNGWLVLTYHQVDDSGQLYAVSPKQFDEQMRLVADSKLRVPTVDKVLDSWFESLR